MSENNNAINVQAHLHHQYFLGLQLMVAVEKGPSVVGDWIFRLFRKQHNEKFLSSFEKLGLAELPHAVACAKYHVLSNNVGGVGVEFMAENEKKAWLRFRYQGGCMTVPLYMGYRLKQAGAFERLVCAEWRYTKKSTAWVCLCFRRLDRSIWVLWLF